MLQILIPFCNVFNKGDQANGMVIVAKISSEYAGPKLHDLRLRMTLNVSSSSKKIQLVV
jgi:hypothetical protein